MVKILIRINKVQPSLKRACTTMNKTKFFNALSGESRNEFLKAFNDASNEIRIALGDDDVQWVLQGEADSRVLVVLLMPKDSGINSANLPDSVKDIDIRMGVVITSSPTAKPVYLILTKNRVPEQ